MRRQGSLKRGLVYALCRAERTRRVRSCSKVTTGTTGSSNTLLDTTGAVRRRQWSGGDGKYETYGGSSRLKWNNYTLEARWRIRKQRYFSYKSKPAYGGSTVTAVLSRAFPPSNQITWSANDELKLQAKLLERVKGHSFNLAVATAEGRELVSMVESNLLKFGRAVNALRRGDFSTAARQLGARPRGTRLKPSDVPGRWLELQYGWLPALKDTYEAGKAFEALSNGPRSTTVVVSSGRKATRDVQPAGDHGVCEWTEVEKYSKRIQYELYEELSASRQLGLTNPLSVVWERIPYSFVVDWFIPIGTYLDDLNQIPKLRGRFLTTVKRYKAGSKVRVGSPLPISVAKVLYVPEDDSWESVSLTRTLSSSLSPPLPTFRFSGALKGKRVWNAISLASQFFLH